MTLPNDAVDYQASTQQFICRGDWDINQLPALNAQLNALALPAPTTVAINGAEITKLDSAGALRLLEWQKQLSAKGFSVSVVAFAPHHQALLTLVDKNLQKELPLPKEVPLGVIANLGRNAIALYKEFRDYLNFVGHLFLEWLRVLANPSHLRFPALTSIIYSSGYQALPIIALLSFMIGVVITYQMGLQLRNYGANVYIVDLLGLAILREFAPLLTAIMVAGRTGSSFTAHLGIMKINQEIDALNTMGVTPGELLLLPRIFGLFISLPLLTMWANIFGIVGGIIMANSMLNITWHDFMVRFPHVIKLKNLMIGLGKAPIFALIIASIGCFQGIQVEENANSLGRNTTRSVVHAIFFIIVADAILSIIFSKLKL